MIKLQFLNLFFLTSVVFASAQPRYIEVVGSAETDIDPNIIVISVQLREYDENKEKITLNKIEGDFMAAVIASKIPKENVRLADLTADAFKPRKKDRDSYSQKTFEITFSKSEDVLTFLGNLRDVKIQNLRVVKLSHTEIPKFRLETKIAALKAAEMKAEALLSSVNSKKGKALLIEERPEDGEWFARNLGDNAIYSNTVNHYNLNSDLPETHNIQLKKIHLRFEVRAQFEIE